MKSRKFDKKLTKQVHVEIGLHRMLKAKTASAGMSIKELLEQYLVDLLDEEYKIS